MARRRSAGRRRRPNRNRVQKRKSAMYRGGPSTVTVTAKCIRTFSFFCPKYSDAYGASVKSWLEGLVKYGTVALKIFTFIINVLDPRDLTATKHVITSAVQSLFIGAEDILFASPLTEREAKAGPANNNVPVQVMVPCIDFKSARMPVAKITITPGSAMKDRSGRYAAVLLPITEEEYPSYVSDPNAPGLNKLDSFEFSDLLQMPGCRIAPFGRAMNMVWKANPTNYAFRFLMIGQSWTDNHDATKNVIGGKPVFRLLIGFQDFANTEGDTVQMYSASNAMVHVDIRARIQLTEPVTALSGRRYIRDWPQVTQDSSKVTATDSLGKVTDIPLSEFYTMDGHLFHREGVRLEDLAIDTP